MKKHVSGRVALTLTVAMVCGCLQWCSAAPIVIQDGEGTAFAGWQITEVAGGLVNGTLQQNVAVGGEVGLLVENSTLFAAPPETDRFFVPSSVSFPGASPANYATLGGTGVRSIRFDFYSDGNGAGPTEPTDLRLYFIGGGFTWYYNLGVSQGWNDFIVNFVYENTGFVGSESGFYSLGRNAANFLTDITTVSQIGFELTYVPNAANQQYGVDNFTLDSEYLVPEPHQGIMIAVALLSLGVVLRRRMPALLGATVGK